MFYCLFWGTFNETNLGNFQYIFTLDEDTYFGAESTKMKTHCRRTGIRLFFQAIHAQKFSKCRGNTGNLLTCKTRQILMTTRGNSDNLINM